MPNRSHNKGEWSEPYVALTALGNGRIGLADENGERMNGQWLNVIEVIRYETENRIVKYNYDPGEVDIDIMVNNEIVVNVNASEFFEAANRLKKEILAGSGTFEVSNDLKSFFERIQLRQVKAKSIEKSDIFITTEHPGTNVVRERIGFSIKSKFGQDPTLFNTGKNSAAIYKLSNMDDDFMETVNSTMDQQGHVAVTERCRMLIDRGCAFEFVGFPVAARARCKAFEENLEMLNPRLPSIIEFILRKHFLTDCSARTVKDMMDVVIEENPCEITRPESKYPYMMKAFLYASYCGLTAGTLWDGRSNVNGGFIAVNEDGEVLANLAMESEAFKNYLYSHCYFEWPATSEGHGNYARVYKENGEYYFRLNFQIRYM